MARSTMEEKPGSKKNSPLVAGTVSSARRDSKKMAKDPKRALEDEDLEEDESFGERIAGLGEMFPETVRNSCCWLGNFMLCATKGGYWIARNALWIASTSAVILALPVIFESERAQQQEEILKRDRGTILGPNAVVSGSGASNALLPGMGMMPGQQK